jgi:hypothetical protein
MIGSLFRVVGAIVGVTKELDRLMATASIEQARQAVLANERLREPSAPGLDLGMGQLVPARAPEGRHVRAG